MSMAGETDGRGRRRAQLAVRAVAVDALNLGVGGTLPRNTLYQQRLGVGAGTVQQALVELRTAGALGLVAHGHQGREITALDVGRLWRAAELPRVVIALPPPGPVEVRGLAEGLAQQFDELEVPFAISHIRGAERRLTRLDDGVDLALVSRGALQHVPPELGRGGVLGLGQGTYYAPRQLVVVTRPDLLRADENYGLRVAIDHDSWDQIELTNAEFPAADGHSRVECKFPRVPVALLRGEADVGVWHTMQTLIPVELAGLRTRPLERAAAKALEYDLSEAMLVAATRPEIRALQGWLDLPRLVAHQTGLIALAREDPDALDAD